MARYFFGPLRVELMPGGRYFRLVEVFTVQDRGTLQITTIPRGFMTDFASVPRPLWNIFPPTGPYSPAAVWHDWLYQFGDLSRSAADQAFLDGMAALSVPWWQRRAMWAGVRLFGWLAWNKYRKMRTFLNDEDDRG